jgi:phosphoribosylformimino-5-aminoimidazole carboxamide ribotide isomerase
MRIIPVLDLKEGRVVHAVAGERNQYQPIKSVLVDTPEPLSVLQSLQKKLGCDEYYVADLDAIQGEGNHERVIARLAAEPGVKLLVDAGSTTMPQVQKMVSPGAIRAVLGTETLPDWQTARDILNVVPAARLVLSLDLRAGRVLARSPELASLAPLDVLTMAKAVGFRSIILLDLARVGMQQGLDLNLLAQARHACPQLELIAGGGVRDPADLVALRNAGMDGVLVATALHRGDITAADLRVR